jgi:signal peptidase II
MPLRKRIALVAVTLIACVGCDQKTKSLAVESLRGRETQSLLSGVIRLEYAENTGGFLSLGASLPEPWKTTVFNVACSAGIAAILLYIFLAAKAGMIQIVGLALICGGGAGNLIDRWAYGYSRDFLNLGLGPVRTGIFNVADVVLMAGCVLLVLVRPKSRAVERAGNAEET